MIIYTAITHARDKLREQPSILGVNGFLAFVDSEQSSKVWDIQRIEHDGGRNAMTAKKLKVLARPLKGHITLWIDGSIELSPKLDCGWLVSRFLDNADMAVFRHQSRTCLYQEAAYCAGKGLDDYRVISEQVLRYTKEGYPANNGLSECSVILRRSNGRVEAFNELWWHEITHGSIRDQISFDYCVWKLGIKVNYFQGSVGYSGLIGNEMLLRHR